MGALKGSYVARLGLVAAALALGWTAVAEAQTRPPRQLVYANTQGPGTLDPHFGTSVVEIETLNHIFEGLYALDEQYRPAPMLASKVDINADATAFTFTLRKGVKFHNGKEMTSADVIASFRRFAKVSPNTALLADVAALEAPDPSTFVVRLKTTNSVFLDMLVSPSSPLAIIPSEFEGKAARDVDPVGTGPFKVGEWQKDSHLVLTRNADYSLLEGTGNNGYAGRKVVSIDSLRYNFVPEANSRVAALRAGEADVIAFIPPELAKPIEASANLAVQTVFPSCMNVIFMHTENPPTNNLAIRQAIRAVVNADEVIIGAGQIARRNPSLLYADSAYYNGDIAARYYDGGIL